MTPFELLWNDTCCVLMAWIQVLVCKSKVWHCHNPRSGCSCSQFDSCCSFISVFGLHLLPRGTSASSAAERCTVLHDAHSLTDCVCGCSLPSSWTTEQERLRPDEPDGKCDAKQKLEGSKKRKEAKQNQTDSRTTTRETLLSVISNVTSSFLSVSTVKVFKEKIQTVEISQCDGDSVSSVS